MKRRSFVALCAFLLSVSAEAQVRKYSNEFLSIGVDARALGMSNAVVASVQDVTAGYWNPAGLVHLRERWEIGLMHAEYFAGIANYDYLAGATPVDDQSTFGASLIRFGVDDILDTSELIDQDGNIDYDRINLFSAADYALLLSYARNTNIEGLSLGGNVKLIYRGIGDFADAFGFGFDLEHSTTPMRGASPQLCGTLPPPSTHGGSIPTNWKRSSSLRAMRFPQMPWN